MLMRSDPFREMDRMFDQFWGTARQASAPLDAYRHGDTFVAHLDLPGVDPASIDISVEQDVVTVTAERHWAPVEGDQVVINERRQGTFTRQLFLGNALDADGIHASYEHGVLTLTMPMAEHARPRRVPITTGAERSTPIEATAS